jgi:hypothetical protein
VTKLPRRFSRPASGMRHVRSGVFSTPSRAADDVRDGDDRAVPGVQPNRASRPRARPSGDGNGVPVDAAIEAALAAPGVDAVTRVHLDETRQRLASGRAEARGSAETPTLSDTLFTFVMPRLQHPEVLGIEQQLVLLERLSEELGGREGALVVRRELRRLALLRQHCNTLVEG